MSKIRTNTTYQPIEPWQPLHVPLDNLQLAPTDLARFIGLDQCQRYLRIRLHQRKYGEEFLKALQSGFQILPPLLLREGYAFKDQSVRKIAATIRVDDIGADAPGRRRRESDNDRILALIDDLAAGEIVVLSQA